MADFRRTRRRRELRGPMRNRIILGLMTVVATVIGPGTAHATDNSVTGAVEMVAAPPSAAVGAFESSSRIRVFDEARADPTSIARRSLNSNAPGDDGRRCYQSHMIHYDAVGISGPALSGSVSFAQKIVAIIATNNGKAPALGALDATDSTFGAAGTTYPKRGYRRRGIERSDRIRLQAVPEDTKGRKGTSDEGWHPPVFTGSNTLTIRLGGDGFDEIRVLTECDDTPPPVLPEAPLDVLLPVTGLGILGLVARRRRSRQASTVV
jgi:hypothetical protein